MKWGKFTLVSVRFVLVF